MEGIYKFTYNVFCVCRTDEEQNISVEYSSLLNKAYSNLQVPLKRAEHLLNLRGEHIGEDQGVEDPMFLMEVMELNEEVRFLKKVIWGCKGQLSNFRWKVLMMTGRD